MSNRENVIISPKRGSQDNLIETDQLPQLTKTGISISTKNDERVQELAQTEDTPRKIIDKSITVEPVLFLTMFALSFQSITTGSLTINKICRLTYNYSEEICKNYTQYPEASDKIQRYATDLGMYQTLISTIPPVLYSFFVGAWSDKHSRKFPIISPAVGYICSTICSICFVYFVSTPPEYLLISSAFVGCSGGLIFIIMGCFSYITDITTEAQRTLRIALADLALFVSLPIGTVLSSIIYSKWSFMPNYIISLVFLCINLLYSVFYLPETIESEDIGKCKAILDMFDVQNVVNNFKILKVKRHGNERTYIYFLLFCVLLLLFPFTGEADQMLRFVQLRFGWDQTMLGYYTAFSIMITAVGTAITFKLILKRFQLSDLVLGMMGFTGTIIKSVIMSVSVAGWMLYLAVSVTFFQFIAMPTVRSFLSKLVTKDEVGKLYALIASFESLSPLVASVIYAQIYKASKDVFPGAIFLVTAAAVAIPLTVFIWIYFNKKKHDKYKRFVEHCDCGPQAITV